MIVSSDPKIRPTTTDRVRSVAVGISAAAMILVPTLGAALTDTEEGAREFDTDITPPDYAFTIWAPIFALAAAGAVQQAVNPAAAVNRRTGWWLAGSYCANTAWSVAAQSNRFRYTPFILPAAAGLAGVAHRRAQNGEQRGAELLVPHGSGLLLGWTSVASVVNVFAVRRRGKLAPTTRTGLVAARLAVTGAAAALSATIATSRRGHTSIALAAGWALATGAANADRTMWTRRAGAAGAALIAGTTAIKIWAGRSRRSQSSPFS